MIIHGLFEKMLQIVIRILLQNGPFNHQETPPYSVISFFASIYIFKVSVHSTVYIIVADDWQIYRLFLYFSPEA
jgi:hypothetical protein